MNENITEVVEPSTARRLPVRLIAGITAGALALLGIGAAVAVPQIVHAAEVNEYAGLHAELAALVTETAELEHDTMLAEVLGAAQSDAARAVQAELAALAEAPDSLIAAATRDQLREAAENLAAWLPEEPLEDDRVPVLAEALNAGAEDEEEEPVAPEWLTIQVPDLYEATGRADAIQVPVEREADERVNAAVLDDIRELIAKAEKARNAQAAAHDRAAGVLAELAALIEAADPAITEAADAAPELATALVAAHPKAAADLLAKVTDTAAEDGRAGLTAFVAAGNAVIAAHQQALADEAAAAAARAGARTYTDPSTGKKVSVPSRNTGSTGSGGSSGGSGGSSSGGSDSGGDNGWVCKMVYSATSVKVPWCNGWDRNYCPPGYPNQGSFYRTNQESGHYCTNIDPGW